jgi:hypothetical protein
MSRQRKAIPLEQQLAAALACLLPQDKRDELRHTRAPAKAVIRLFTMHHLDFHALSNEDRWFNLHPMTRPAHDARFAVDVAAIAKVKRLQRGPRKPRFKIAQRRNPWPPKGTRPIRNANDFRC